MNFEKVGKMSNVAENVAISKYKYVYVVAGSYQQYKEFCNTLDLNPMSSRIRYVDSFIALAGVDGRSNDNLLVFYGTYFLRNDNRHIGEMISERGFEDGRNVFSYEYGHWINLWGL